MTAQLNDPNNNDYFSFYRAGALWKTRDDIDAIDADTGRHVFIPAFEMIMVIKIVEAKFALTPEWVSIKALYKNRICYIDDIDVGLNFNFNP